MTVSAASVRPLVLSAEAAGAEFSPCGRYRYRLWRAWGPGPRLGWVMLNPSTADARADDPTIRKCTGFAKRAGFDGIEVVNLFAWRATDPGELARAHGSGIDVVGPDNDEHLRGVGTGTLVLAWGAHPAQHLARRAFTVMEFVRVTRVEPRRTMCLGRTGAGMPRHPLMARYAPLEPWA